MRKPRDPLLKVVLILFIDMHITWYLYIKGDRKVPLVHKGVWMIEKSRARLRSLKTLCYSVMILPQVHLRKPCYDFYFL